MTEKTVNYTVADTARLVEAYESANGVYEDEQAVIVGFADELGKTVASIRAKLQSEGVYNAKAKTARKASVKKDEIVDRIAELVGVDYEQADSLTKANKFILAKVYGVLNAKING